MKRSAGSPRNTLPVLLLATALLLAPSSSASADRLRFSAEDVLRLTQGGYPQEEIIRLIRLSDSRYVISADDAIVLKRAGVSEPVIAEMLSRPEPHPVSLEKTKRPAPARPEPAERPRSRVSIAYSGKQLKVERRVTPLFAPSSDRAAPAVMLDGLEVLLLQEQGGELPPGGRAAKIAATLNGLTRNGLGHFSAADSGAGVVFRNADGRVVDVLAVSAADAAAFASRKGAVV
ncbi:MAG TPA: hypothetical protein VLO07_08985, partial [Thermoanaerobaculia bacterium]|nr:hypothetical protein [Thermoanaerobaculia bacterium]